MSGPPEQYGNRPPPGAGNRPPGQYGNRPPDQRSNRPPEQDDNRPPDQRRNRPPEQYDNRPPDQRGNRPPEQYDNRPPDQRRNRPPEQYDNRPPDQRGNRPPEQYDNRPPDQRRNRPPDQRGYRPPEQDGSRPPDQYRNRPPEQYGNRPPDQYGNRPPEQYGNRPPDQRGYRPPDQRGNRPPDQRGNRPPDQRGNRPPQGYGNMPPPHSGQPSRIPSQASGAGDSRPPEQGRYGNITNRPIIGQDTADPETCGFFECAAICLSFIGVILTFPITIWFCLKFVQEYERAVIFRLGRVRSGGARGPGVFFILPCIDEYRCVDLRTINYNVPAQEILTKDSVSCRVDAIVFYKVFAPNVAVANVKDYRGSTALLAATTLRTVLGMQTLADIQGERKQICEQMQSLLDIATDPWGIKVERIELTDITLPMDLQRKLAVEAEAGREATANAIAAEGELKASTALKDAAKIMMESPGALQLRYLQTLNTIAAEKNSTILFPLPIDLLAPFTRR